MTGIVRLIPVMLVVATIPVGAQEAPELLHSVDSGLAQRLDAYNRTFLDDRLYFAARYRIVRADVDLLFSERDILITPFNDVDSIEVLAQELRNRDGDDPVWVGRYPNDPVFERFGPPGLAVKINLHAWDVDTAGNASVSGLNRFEFSPAWQIDQNGRPFLPGGSDENSSVVAGPPPQTPEQIDRHQRLLHLSKRTFYSVGAILNTPNGHKYVITPLRFTPKYSVVYELLPGAVPGRIDREPGEPEYRNDRERAQLQRYREFRDRLPSEEGKAVRGDLQ